MSPGRRLRHACAVLGLATALSIGAGGVFPASAAGPEGVVRGAGSPNAVPGSYLVVLKEQAGAGGSLRSAAQALARSYGGTVRRTYDAALHGFAADLSARQARRLAADPSVALVSQNRRVRADDTQPDPESWGLDRIDHRRLPLDRRYDYPATAGRGVTAYIVDTGVRVTQEEFEGRASNGFDAIDGDNVAQDEHGHGTHVAGTVAGSTFGAAKAASIVAVRVLDDSGYGTTEQVVAGIDWVTGHAVKPAVVNLSLGGEPDEVLDAAVRNSIASGLTYAVAAGNDGTDASQHSPARVPTALTVGATDQDDVRASFSNYGPLVDLFAPGVDIVSALSWVDVGGIGTTMSGTSMATPHVTAAAALHLAAHPAATPAQVAAALTAAATTGSVQDAGPGSPDRLLYTGTAPVRAPGPLFTNGTDVAIDGTVESAITVTGVPGHAPADLDVRLAIKHGWRGDLTIDLIAPDGTAYRLRDEDIADGRPDLTALYGVDASARTANGVWKLRATDRYGYFPGFIDSWSLRF
ncbi:S8 family peptidase [Kitasatospora sp. NPDC092286]|uniref:S8 family peptidase n=1 Tax=Kitasatospora sp. NPDC092286 TaxID=3364087 RepID=UPI003809B013